MGPVWCQEKALTGTRLHTSVWLMKETLQDVGFHITVAVRVFGTQGGARYPPKPQILPRTLNRVLNGGGLSASSISILVLHD